MDEGWPSPLFKASQCGHVDVVRFLLKEGASVNEPLHVSSNKSPLHAASKKGHLSTVMLLLSHGADRGTVGGATGARTAGV